MPRDDITCFSYFFLVWSQAR